MSKVCDECFKPFKNTKLYLIGRKKNKKSVLMKFCRFDCLYNCVRELHKMRERIKQGHPAIRKD